MIKLVFATLAILMSGVSFSQTRGNGFLISGHPGEVHKITLFLGYRNNHQDDPTESKALGECRYEALVTIHDISNQVEDPPPFEVKLSEGESTTLTIKMKDFKATAPSTLLVTPKVTRHTGSGSCGLLVNSRLEKEETGYTITSGQNGNRSVDYFIKYGTLLEDKLEDKAPIND